MLDVDAKFHVSYLKLIQSAFSFEILASVTETWSEITIQTLLKKIYLATKPYILNCSRMPLVNQNNKYNFPPIDAELVTACFKISHCSYFTFLNFSCKDLNIIHKHHRAFPPNDSPGDGMRMLWREVSCCDTTSQPVDELQSPASKDLRVPLLCTDPGDSVNALCSTLYCPSKSQAQ